MLWWMYRVPLLAGKMSFKIDKCRVSTYGTGSTFIK
jgi:hypothetical protein